MVQFAKILSDSLSIYSFCASSRNCPAQIEHHHTCIFYIYNLFGGGRISCCSCSHLRFLFFFLICVCNTSLWNVSIKRVCSGVFWRKRKSFPVSELWKGVEDDHQIRIDSSQERSQERDAAKADLQMLEAVNFWTTPTQNFWESSRLKVRTVLIFSQREAISI